MVNRWRVILAAAVIFLAGAGTGGVIVRNYAPKIVKRTHLSPPLPIPPERRHEYISKLDRELTLTAEQRTQAEAILAESQKRMKQLWEPMEPQVKEEYRRTRREIAAILTPEQAEKMKNMRKGRDSRDDNRHQENGKSLKSESQKHCSKPYYCF